MYQMTCKETADIERLQAIYRANRQILVDLYFQTDRLKQGQISFKYLNAHEISFSQVGFLSNALIMRRQFACDVFEYFNEKYFLDLNVYSIRDKFPTYAKYGEIDPALHWQEVLDLLCGMVGDDFEAYGQEKARFHLTRQFNSPNSWNGKVSIKKNTLIFRNAPWYAIKKPLYRLISVYESGSVALCKAYQKEVDFYARDCWDWRELDGMIERVKKYKNGRVDAVFDNEKHAQYFYAACLADRAGD